MDRNPHLLPLSHAELAVALRKESVDRNTVTLLSPSYPLSSLSARRAWIEIRRFRAIQHPKIESLSARRAWIEIRNAETLSGSVCVALRKESVDRN